MTSGLDRVRSVTPWVLREGIALVLPCGREFGAIPERPPTLGGEIVQAPHPREGTQERPKPHTPKISLHEGTDQSPP